MTKGDAVVERGSQRLRQLSQRMATRGGAASKLAQPLAEDAAFLRKLKPSLIKARARGEAPTDQTPGEPVYAPTGPQLGKRPTRRGKGPNPFVVVGVAFAVGIALAKVVDWRSHAHPRE